MLSRLVFVAALWIVACVPDGPPQGTAASASSHPPSPSRAVAKPRASVSSRPSPAPPGSVVRGAAPPERTADRLLTSPFVDDFERATLGPNWAAKSARWGIEHGRLCGQGARNHPVWLRRRLPVNARIEFDAETASEEGDIKAEFWGDGRSSAQAVSYDDATSYLTIFGGWRNRYHVLARLDEHAKTRKEVQVDPASDDPRERPVAVGQTYHFKVERNDGKSVRWYVDDIEILNYPDDEPLTGPGHEHFGFNDWNVRICFDNLKITPLK